MKFTGLVQVWFAAGDQTYVDTFRLRRTELCLTADVTPKARTQVMIDPTKALSMNYRYEAVEGSSVPADVRVNQASRMLQNALMTLSYIPKVQLDIGQFKLPLSLEGLYPSSSLETVERAPFLSDRARGGAYGDVREVGIMARGKVTSYLEYQIGVFNGLGENQNDLDKDDRKSIAGRAVVRPGRIRGLQIGVSAALDAHRAPLGEQQRLGVDLLFTRGQLTLKCEYMQGRDGPLERQGYYLHAGFKVSPIVETVFRYDTWDPNIRAEDDASNVRERDFIAGINVLIDADHVKWQGNYVRKTHSGGIVPTGNVLLTDMQLSW